jgi:hypothetical protein
MWNPQPVQATIEFRDFRFRITLEQRTRLNKLQAVYTIEIGVTTLWWYAPAAALAVDSEINLDYG